MPSPLKSPVAMLPALAAREHQVGRVASRVKRQSSIPIAQEICTDP